MEQYVINTSYSTERMNLIAKNAGARNKRFIRVVFCLYALFNLYMGVKHFGLGQIGDGIRDIVIIIVCIAVIVGSIILPPILFRTLLTNRGLDKEIKVEIADEICKVETYKDAKELPVDTVNVIRDFPKYVELKFESRITLYLFKDDFVTGEPSDLIDYVFDRIRAPKSPTSAM